MIAKNLLKEKEDIRHLQNLGRHLNLFFQKVKPLLKPKLSLKEIDDFCYNYLQYNKLSSAIFGYRGFPSYISTSLNSTIAHGIPDSKKLKEGDIITLDTMFEKDGYYVDSASTFLIGNCSRQDKSLFRLSKATFDAILLRLKVGEKISSIANIIQEEAKFRGLNVFYQFSSHATGFTQHEEIKIKHIKNDDDFILKEGFVFTIEPIFTFGDVTCLKLNDKSYISLDGENSCQFEHTLAIYNNKVKILTGF